MSNAHAFRATGDVPALGLEHDVNCEVLGFLEVACGKDDRSLDAKVGTIRSYLEAVGGNMTIEYVMGDHRVQIA